MALEPSSWQNYGQGWQVCSRTVENWKNRFIFATHTHTHTHRHGVVVVCRKLSLKTTSAGKTGLNEEFLQEREREGIEVRNHKTRHQGSYSLLLQLLCSIQYKFHWFWDHFSLTYVPIYMYIYIYKPLEEGAGIHTHTRIYVYIYIYMHVEFCPRTLWHASQTKRLNGRLDDC